MQDRNQAKQSGQSGKDHCTDVNATFLVLHSIREKLIREKLIREKLIRETLIREALIN